MKKVLVTGFEPFGGSDINPSGQTAQNLDGTRVGEYYVEGTVLPVSWSDTLPRLYRAIEDTDPGAVVCLGQGGREAVTPERVAINYTRGKDNDEAERKGEPVVSEGPDGLFTTLPIEAIVEALTDAGIPARISNSAGTYLCNCAMYGLLSYLAEDADAAKAGFVHVPMLPRQAAAVDGRRTVPSMSQELIDRAVCITVREIFSS